MSTQTRKLIFLLVSVALFIISLTVPALYVDRQNEPEVNSLLLVLLGWGGIGHPSSFPWFANPALFCAWLTFMPAKKTVAMARLPMVAALIATVLASSHLFFKVMMVDEAGHVGAIIKRGPGYWFWLASCVTFFAGTLNIYFIEKKQAQT